MNPAWEYYQFTDCYPMPLGQLNGYGSEGWELAALVFDEHNPPHERWRYVFKRQKGWVAAPQGDIVEAINDKMLRARAALKAGE